jgi:hypothetical protein
MDGQYLVPAIAQLALVMAEHQTAKISTDGEEGGSFGHFMDWDFIFREWKASRWPRADHFCYSTAKSEK